MGNYNRDRGSRPGGGRGFQRRGFSGRGSSGPAQMFQTTCDKCRMNCEVPFRPTNGRPIFCSNCFESNRNSDSERFESRRPSFGPPRGGAGGEDRQMFDAVCDECKNSCKVPFRPSSDKPIYCSNCFGEKKEGRGVDRPQNNDQFKELHDKLDKILLMLGSNTSAQTPVEQPVMVAQEVIEEKVQPTQEVEAKTPRKKSSKKK